MHVYVKLKTKCNYLSQVFIWISMNLKQKKQKQKIHMKIHSKTLKQQLSNIPRM